MNLSVQSLRPYLRQIPKIMLISVGVIFLVLLIYIAALVPGMPGIDKLREARTAQPSVLLALDGTPIGSFNSKQQDRIPLNSVSPHVIDALVATEDKRFYSHHGVDFMRTFSAVAHTLGGDTQGGSTITQQLARNLFPEEIGRARSLNRKVRETITALRIEGSYTKDEILETYLNSVPFLYNVVGIEMAARTYFDKSAADLDVLESATLIGMLKGTSYYNPVINPERAQKRRNVVLGQMVKYKVLPQTELDTLKDEPLKINFSKQADVSSVAPHFAAHARKWLIEWADQHDFNLYADGLIIQTTIDLRLQEAATRAVERQGQALQTIADVEWSQGSAQMMSSSTAAYASAAARKKFEPFRQFWATHPELLAAFIRERPEYKQAVAGGAMPADAIRQTLQDTKVIAAMMTAKTRLQAGFVAIDPHSGEVRAWVGSRDFIEDQYDHVIQAERQPGSTFKPFVYGAALERGIRPDHLYVDNSIEMRFTDGTVWRPTDMTGASGQQMTLREGLIHSKNTITAQVMQAVGLPSIISLAQAMGVNQSKLEAVPSLALGTSPVTLMEMVSAYATISREGEYNKPVFIRSIADRTGKQLALFGKAPGSAGQRVMSQNTAIELIDMMRGVVNRGTGTAVKTRFGIVADIAGKTGTTQKNTDGWFILMHPDLVAGAWVGFNDARVTMRSNYWGQGGHNAILIVGDFFRDAMKSKVVDASARFPTAPSASIAARFNLPPEDWASETGVPEESVQPPAVPAGNDAPAAIIIRGDKNGVVIENARGDTGAAGGAAAGTAPRGEPAAPKNAQELEKILGGMGRDPATGAVAAPPPLTPPAPVRRPDVRPAAAQSEGGI